MSTPYDFDCKCRINNNNGYKGRQSENLFNGELHDVFEAVRHLPDYPQSVTSVPVAKHRGALWLDQRTKKLYMWVGPGFKHDKVRNGWLPVFADQFQIIDEITNDIPSANPVKGQLWLYNGVLMYYDGTGWQPVKALEALDSQFNVSLFDDYKIYSPLNRMGSVVISDMELELHLAMQKKYFYSDVDIELGNHEKVDNRWRFGDHHVGEYTNINFDLNDVSYQYLIPSERTDRIFVDHTLDKKYLRQNDSVIQYKRSYLLDEEPVYNDDTPMIAHVKQPSLVHLNPGRLTNIRKRLFKVDKYNPKIMCSPSNTEYYGYKVGEIGGHFLIPTRDIERENYEYQKLIDSLNNDKKDALAQALKEQGYDIETLFSNQLQLGTGDYEVLDGGIFLSNAAAQEYDYVLAITFEFSWLNATGILRQVSTSTLSTSFYVPQKLGPMNIFVNGFDYEDSYWSWDADNKVVTIAEDISERHKYDVSVLGVFAHEYGYIRKTNIVDADLLTTGNLTKSWVESPHSAKVAYISTVHKFNKPLIFVNGIALSGGGLQWEYYNRSTLQTSSSVTNSFILKGVSSDMCWTVIEMQQQVNTYDASGVLQSSENIDICIKDDGYLDTNPSNCLTNDNGDYVIPIPTNWRTKIRYEGITGESYYKRPKIVLFVNGLMVKREDIFYDPVRYTIMCEGLEPGMFYIILDDSRDLLYTEDMENGIKPAIGIGQVDQTLVYHNGYLLNESSSYLYYGDSNTAAISAEHGEIRAFGGGTIWKVFNTNTADEREGIRGGWEDITTIAETIRTVDSLTGRTTATKEDIPAQVRGFSNSYTNNGNAITLSKELADSSEGQIIVYGYNFANYIRNPIRPITCWLHSNDKGTVFLKEAGYDTEYINLINNKDSSDLAITVIDPVDPNSIITMKERLANYYKFLIDAFNKWTADSQVSGSIATRISLYLADSVRETSIYPNLSGYYYKGVYVRNTEEEDEYQSLEDLCYGTPWEHKVFIGKDFDPAKDYVMVWFNGVRQYPEYNYTIVPLYVDSVFKGYEIKFGKPIGVSIDEIFDEDGYIQTPRGEGNTVPEEYDKELITGIITYIIERSDNGSPVCRYCILDHESMLQGAQNVYTTKNLDAAHMDENTWQRDSSSDFSLYPGAITVYADGVRLPSEVYTILDNYTIVINDTQPWIGGSKYPEDKYLDNYGKVKTFRHLKPEEILIEVRPDSRWVHRTTHVDIGTSGNIEISALDQGFPVNILSTQDTILIFIDGLYHGLSVNDGYIINRAAGTISIIDSTVIEALRKDDLETYLTTHTKYNTLFATEIAAYRARKANKVHEITLEWR